MAEAFKKANFKISTTLILNGNQPSILLSKKVSVKIKKYIKLSPRTLIKHIIHDLKQLIKPNKKIVQNWDTISQEVNSKNDNKKILITNLDRPDVVQAYLNADLFVFASNIEYSPLVLFESAAAGLPFLTVPVGNSEEIIKWTKGGILCPAQIDDNGRTIVDTNVLAEKILELANNLNHRKKLGVQGKYNWQKRFSWEKITLEYEKILKGNFN